MKYYEMFYFFSLVEKAPQLLKRKFLGIYNLKCLRKIKSVLKTVLFLRF